MPPFDPEDRYTHPLDLMLVQGGPVTMFRRASALDEATAWLAGQGYRVVTLDGASWRTGDDMHRDLARELDFPGHYGGNDAALEDCLGDVAAGDHGTDPGARGLAVVVLGYDGFHRRSERSARLLLDVFARQARVAALFGNRMLLLLQSDDPDLDPGPVGATPVMWNPAEWLRARRR